MRQRLARAGMRALLGLLRGVAALPDPIVRGAGSAFGTLLYWLVAPRRRIARVNLELCLPELDAASREAIVREHFRLFSRSFFERFIIWHGSPERIRRLVRIEHLERFHELRAAGPLIVLAPHFVGLDAGGLRLTLEAHMATMYANQSNAVLNDAIRAGRMRFNEPILISRQDGIRAAVRVLRDRVPFLFLPDMDLGPRDSVFVPFFGVPAATVTAVGRLARLTGARVLPFVTRMTPQGYVGTFYPPWEDYPGEDIEAATRHMNAFIEGCVRQMPAQYLWTHKRFKTRPPGEPSPYRRALRGSKRQPVEEGDQR